MRKTPLFILMLALLCVPFISSRASTVTGYEYNPMPDGGHIDYLLYTLDAGDAYLVRQSTGQVATSILSTASDYRIDINHKTYVANPLYQPQMASFIYDANCSAFGSQSYFPGYSTFPASPNPVDSQALWAGFGTAWDSTRYTPYIGEVRNQTGGFVFPPEPELPLFPFVGQVLDVHSSVYHSCASPTVDVADWRSTLYTLTHLAGWKLWSDVWITVLIERSGSQPHVFEYVFAKNIGVVDAWYGYYTAGTGQIVGYEQVMYYPTPTPTPTPTP